MNSPARRVNIGYYAHHQGAGHVMRALTIGAHVPQPMTVFSSAPPVQFNLPPMVEYCELPTDFDNESVIVDSFSGLHYTPLGVAGLRDRMGRLVDWFRQAWPCILVVDVSVEIGLLARLCGVPTIFVRQRGTRSDSAHSLAYASATRLLAPYPRELDEPSIQKEWVAKTNYVGLVSRYGRTMRQCESKPFHVTVICGHGGTQFTIADVAAAARASCDWRWTVIGPVSGERDGLPSNLELVGMVSEPLPWLASASVVVGSCGDTLVGEVADLRRPFVCIPEARPFDEQRSVAKLLATAGLAIHCPEWPIAHKWPSILEQALQLDVTRWNTATDGEGAARAANVIIKTAQQIFR